MLGIYKCIIDLKRQKERVKENKRKFVIQKASVDLFALSKDGHSHTICMC